MNPHLSALTLTASVVIALNACSDRTVVTASHDKQRAHNGGVTVESTTSSDGKLNANISIGDPLDLSLGETSASGKNATIVSKSRARTLSGSAKPNAVDSRPSREIYYLNGAVDSYVEYTYQGTTRTRRAWYNGSGPDAVWFTADDVVGSYTSYVSDVPNVNHVSYNGAGPDNAWFTADDVISRYEMKLIDAIGSNVGDAVYNQAGTDGSWFTADDTIAWVTSEGLSNSGDPYWVLYIDAGTDGNWATLEDNGKGHFSLKNLDAAGNPSKHILFANAGLDNTLFTPDDPVIYYHAYEYDAQNELARSVLYRGGAGADGQWFTPDDVVRSCKVVERDANNLPYRTVSYKPGVDGACFTADDEVWGYHSDEFNSAGNVIRTVCYFGAGPDGIWFTPDDEIATEELFIAP